MLVLSIAAFAWSSGLPAAPLLQPAPQQSSADSYFGARYGTLAHFPAGIFRLQRESDNGDGAIYASADGAVLLIYATPNPNPLPVRDYLTGRINGQRGRVTYRHVGRDHAVMSGREGDRIFYQRFQFDGMGGLVHSFRLEYPTRLQRRYGPIIPNISVRPGR